MCQTQKVSFEETVRGSNVYRFIQYLIGKLLMVVNNCQKGLDVATFFASVERLEKYQFHKKGLVDSL